MLRVNIENAKEFLSLAYKNRSEIVVCMLGAPGIGKTDAVYQHAKEVGANVVTIIASQILPNEVSGITMPVEDTHSMEVYDHARLSSLKDGDILFFDELLEADEQVLSACLTLIESRLMMSGRKLPDVQIIAASNPTKKPVQLRASLRQRFMWIDVIYDKKVFSNYLTDRYDSRFASLSLYATDKDDGEYNLLSPRTLCKIIDMTLNADGDESFLALSFADSIEPMLRKDLSDLLADSNSVRLVLSNMEAWAISEMEGTEKEECKSFMHQVKDKLNGKRSNKLWCKEDLKETLKSVYKASFESSEAVTKMLSSVSLEGEIVNVEENQI